MSLPVYLPNVLPDGSDIPFYLFGNRAHALTASEPLNIDNPSRIRFLTDHFLFRFFCV